MPQKEKSKTKTTKKKMEPKAKSKVKSKPKAKAKSEPKAKPNGAKAVLSGAVIVAVRDKVDIRILKLIQAGSTTKTKIRKAIRLTPKQRELLGDSEYIVVHNAFLRLTRKNLVAYDKDRKQWSVTAAGHGSV